MVTNNRDSFGRRLLSFVVTFIIIVLLAMLLAWTYNKFKANTNGNNNNQNNNGEVINNNGSNNNGSNNNGSNNGSNNNNNNNNNNNSNNNGSNNNGSNNNGSSNNGSNGNAVVYDSKYIENINAMKAVAKSYYTVDRLPENVGDTKQLTLSEMVEKKLIFRFADKNNNYCDEESSKVVITKNSNTNYLMRVELNCGDQKDYILETIGCYDVCAYGNCKKEEQTRYIT